MWTLIKGGRIIDPSRGIDEVGDLVIDGSIIVDSQSDLDPDQVIDAAGLWVVPGLVDAHVHLREPGQEYKEDITSGLRAAAAGGFTAVMPMPNTIPANDDPKITRMMIERSKALGGTRIFPMAAATRGRLGKEITSMAELYDAGAVAFSDDGDGLADDRVMAQALEGCRKLGVPFAQHAEDPSLSGNGVIHDGAVSAQLGVPGWPVEAEQAMIDRDLALVEKTGARLHVQHISAMASVALVRRAKLAGAPVTAEVTPHHLHLTDEAASDGSTSAKVNPPLRPRRHVEACREALSSGVIDIVASDHAPHAPEDKQGDLNSAAFGMVGLETALPLMLILVNEGIITPGRLIEAMSTAPCRIFGLPGGALTPGSVADVTLINPSHPHAIDPSTFKSKSRNTPFTGKKVPGMAVRTIIGGKTVFEWR